MKATETKLFCGIVYKPLQGLYIYKMIKDENHKAVRSCNTKQRPFTPAWFGGKSADEPVSNKVTCYAVKHALVVFDG